MANPSGPSDDVIAEAWRLKEKENRSTRYIAAALGVSQTTARDYITKGSVAEGWIRLYDAAESRNAATARLGEYAVRAIEWLDQCDKPTDAAAIFAVLLSIEKRLAAMNGYDAPSRIAVGDDKGPPAAPDPGLMRAVRKLRDRDEVDTRELRAGRPGVIEGGAQDG